MNALKPILMIILVMSIFTLFIVPIEAGTFPAWIDEDLIQLMLIILCVVCALVLIR